MDFVAAGAFVFHKHTLFLAEVRQITGFTGDEEIEYAKNLMLIE